MIQKKQSVKIIYDSAAATKRARQIVTKLVEEEGKSHDEISRLCDTTVLSLLDGATPVLRRPQYFALAAHFNASLMWMWTGLGPQFIKPDGQDFRIA